MRNGVRDKLKRENSSSRGGFVTGSSHKDGKLIGSEADYIPRRNQNYGKLKRQNSRSRSRDKLKRETSSSRGGFVTGLWHKDGKLIGSEADDIPRRSQSRDKLKHQNSTAARREDARDFALGPLPNNTDESVRKAHSILLKTHDVLAEDNDVSVQLQSCLKGEIADAIQKLLKHRKSNTSGHPDNESAAAGVEVYMYRKERDNTSKLLDSLKSAETQIEERLAEAEETLRIELEKQSTKPRSIVTQEPKKRKQELSKIKKFRLDIVECLMAAESAADELKEEKKIISREIDDVQASDTHHTVRDLLVSQRQKLSEEIKKNRKERGEMTAMIDRLKKLYDKIPNRVSGVEEEETLESIIAEFSGAKIPAPNSSARLTMSGQRTQSDASTRPTMRSRRAKSERGTSSSIFADREHREALSRNARLGVERGRSMGSSHKGLRDGRKGLNSPGSLPSFPEYATEDLHASGWLYLHITGQSFRDLAELARNSAPDLPGLANAESSASRLQQKRDKVRLAENNLKAMNMTMRSLRSWVPDDQSIGLDIGF
jgi:hypothetical protein